MCHFGQAASSLLSWWLNQPVKQQFIIITNPWKLRMPNLAYFLRGQDESTLFLFSFGLITNCIKQKNSDGRRNLCDATKADVLIGPSASLRKDFSLVGLPLSLKLLHTRNNTKGANLKIVCPGLLFHVLLTL